MEIYRASVLSVFAAACLLASAKDYSYGRWNVTVEKNTGMVTAVCGADTILNRSVASWGSDGDVRNFTSCRSVNTTIKKDVLVLGQQASVVNITGKTENGTRAQLALTLFKDKPAMLTQLSLEGKDASEGVDFMMPASNSASISFSGVDNQQLFVPYDNDAWIRYKLTPFGSPAPESYEIGALIDAVGRHGIIAGSVDHDTWKSAVKYVTGTVSRVDSLSLYAGASSSITRDVRRHGKVSGALVKSPRFIIAVTPDWRDGMELFADMCAASAPNQTKKGPRPFGWNSWGDLQTKVNFDNACEVSDFISKELSPAFCGSDSSVVINLDAFWDFGLREDQHKEFVAHCRANGQKAGIYFCPFTDWGKNPDAVVGEAPEYKMGELYLRCNGQPIEFDGAPALDPTHPATKKRIKSYFDKFRDWGYEYVKIDFMAHGAYESDHHFGKGIMTGTQAFNEGMKYIDSVAGEDMWINLSIAPLFPANYANSRRIGCDAWSNIGSTEYTLNALTYGWWLDHLYHYNDADHIVFKEVSEGENRARLLSSAITGVFFLGDNYSHSGDNTTLDRGRRFATVGRINEMARRTKSFRPLRPGRGDHAAEIFEGRDGKTIWVAIFNFDDAPARKNFSLGELAVESSAVADMTELWSDRTLSAAGDGTVTVDLPAKDAAVIEINLK